MRVIIVGSTQCAAGSTTLSICLMNLLKKKDLRVQAFKFGPVDFSENALFEEATGRMTVNLDPWSVPKDCLLSCVHRYSDECDIAIVDGCGGLFDQRWNNVNWTTAEISKFFSAPIILVLDAAPLGQSVAAIIKGFENFDKKVKIAGIIFNRVSGELHANILAESVKKSGIKAEIMGYINEDSDLLCLEDWQLGLSSNNNNNSSNKNIAQSQSILNEKNFIKTYVECVDKVKKEIDIDRIIEISTLAKVPKCPETNLSDMNNPAPDDLVTVKIAVAKDAAFSFYFHENFIMLEAAKAELVFFSPLEDEKLPEGCSGLYFGGGNLENYVSALAKNKRLMASINAFARAGGIIYAEGSGLTYLSESIQLIKEFPKKLVGVFPFQTRISETPMTSEGGYVEVEIGENCPLFKSGDRIKGYVSKRCQIIQEVVLSALNDDYYHSQKGYELSYKLHFEKGIKRNDGISEGYTFENVVGSFVHLQFASCKNAATELVTLCRTIDVNQVYEVIKKEMQSFTEQAHEIKKPKKSHKNLHRRNVSIDNLEKKRVLNGQTVESYSKINDSAKEGKEVMYNGTSTTATVMMNYSNEFAAAPKTSLNIRQSFDNIFKKSESYHYNQQQQQQNQNQQYQEYSSVNTSVYSVKDNEKEISLTQKKKRQFRLNLTFDDADETKSPTSSNNKTKKLHCNDEIVCLSSYAVEILFALGLEKRLVGVTNICKYPEDVQKGREIVARTKFDVTGLTDGRIEMKLKDFWCRQESAFNIDSNYLRHHRPGLVIVEEGGDPNVPALEAALGNKNGPFATLGPVSKTNILALKYKRLNEIFDIMLKIGKAARVKEISDSIVDKLRTRIATVGSLVSTAYPCERVVVLTCLNPLTIGGYWIPEMVLLAGGEPHGPRAGCSHQRISWQELRNLEPELLIVAAASWEETKLELIQMATIPGWWGLPALKSGQLYVCDSSLFTIPGPRIVDGVELLARIMHPSLAGHYGKSGMAWSCMLRNGHRCRACNLPRQFCSLL